MSDELEYRKFEYVVPKIGDDLEFLYLLQRIIESYPDADKYAAFKWWKAKLGII